MVRNAIFLALAALCACSTKKTDVGSTPSASAAAAALPPPNAALVGHVKAHAEGCTINVESGQAYSCKPGISDAARKFVLDGKPTDFAATLVPLMARRDDPKTSAAAVELMTSFFDYLGDDGKKANATPAVAEALLAVFKESSGPRASRLAKPAVQVATLAQLNEKVVAVLDSHPTKNAQNEGYRALLTYGRSPLFPPVQEAAKRPDNTVAALDAPRSMYKATDAEKAPICTWAKGFLSHADPEAAASAGRDMVWCRGPYIDALLAEAETRLSSKRFKNPFAMVMREPCFEFAGKLTPSAADVAQCDRVYAFLEKAANDATVDDVTRGQALWNIYYQRRDAKTLTLMRKYEKSPNKEIAKQAADAIKSLTETYKLKG